MKKAILWKVLLHNISKYLRSPVSIFDLWPFARDGRVKNKKKTTPESRETNKVYAVLLQI